MASIRLSGTLLNSLGEVDVGGVMTFTHLTTTGETIASTKTELIVPPDGSYSIDVEYGLIRIDYTTDNTQRFVATVIVNSDSTATSIPELLSATTPVAKPVIIQMQGLVADAVAAADRSEAFATAAVFNAETVADMKASAIAFSSLDRIDTKCYSKTGYGAARFLVVTSVIYESLTGLLVADEIRDHTLLNGLIAVLMPENGVIGVQQCGAIPYDYTGAIPYDGTGVAADNTRAFRAAHLSLRSEWDARKASYDPSHAANRNVELTNFYRQRDAYLAWVAAGSDPATEAAMRADWVADTTVFTNPVGFVPKTLTWTTKIESGDYNLSSGYAIPKGMTSFCDGQGSARLRILNSTSEFPIGGGGAANPNVIPLVELGSVLVDYFYGGEGWGTFETEEYPAGANLTAFPTRGIYVRDPAPSVHGLYISPENTNTAVHVASIPGFVMSDLWLQAANGIVLGDGAADGIISKITIDSSTANGIVFKNCKNINIDEVYTFNNLFPLKVTGSPENIDIGSVQTNFSEFAALRVEASAIPRNFKISKLICNQNVQYGTFTAAVDMVSTGGGEITIDRLEVYNANWGVIVLPSNTLNIGTAVIKQARSNIAVNSLGYNEFVQGTAAKGLYVQNATIRVGRLETDILSDWAIGYVTGNLETIFEVKSGVIEGQVQSASPLVFINNTNPFSKVRLTDIDNQTGLDLFNAQDFTEVTFSNVKKPFPIVSEGGRLAIKVPFNNGSMYDFTVRTNTLVGGSTLYRKVGKYNVSVEKLFNAGSTSWHANLTTISSNNFGATVPAIDLQVDIGAVGDGVTILTSSSDYLVFSIPSSYTSISYNLSPSIS